MKIIVDAFGGDHAPVQVLKGCAMAVKEYDVQIIACGNEQIIRKVCTEQNISLQGIEISHTEDVIAVEDEPATILKAHSDCSMARGMKLLAEGEGDAFVSAGSTGAVVVGASMIVKRMKGIKRAALATVIPTMQGCYMLMDIGANAECRPEMLVQFGVMGSAYMQQIRGLSDPKVGLINIGTEETKGNDLQLQAHALLKKAPIRFVGNVEARGLPFGECDVAVTDGFTGNIALKLIEGLGSSFSAEIKRILFDGFVAKLGALCVAKGFSQFKRKMDYKEYGGAPLLGIAKPVIKAHGSSDAKAFKNAIRQAKECTENGVIERIQEKLDVMKTQLAEEKTQN